MTTTFVKASPDRKRVETVLAGLSGISRGSHYSYDLHEAGTDSVGRRLYGISRSLHAPEDPEAGPMVEAIFFTEARPL